MGSGDLVSGGFDCEVVLWEHSTGRRKAHNHLGIDSDGTSMGINPPWIHSLAYACNGRSLLCATGDGGVCLREASTLRLLAREEAHRSFTSCIHVPFDRDCAGDVAGRVAFSGGNDGKVHAWRIQDSAKPAKRKKGKNRNNAAGGGSGSSSGQDLISLWTLDHGEKINAIATWAGSTVRRANVSLGSTDDELDQQAQLDATRSFHLFVCDTSKEVSCYTY